LSFGFHFFRLQLRSFGGENFKNCGQSGGKRGVGGKMQGNLHGNQGIQVSLGFDLSSLFIYI